MDAPEQKEETERPDAIWFLLVAYCIGVVVNFALILISALLPEGRIDPVALGVSLIAMALRGIGFVRLFFFKRDAWIYLVVALFIMMVSTVLDLVLGGVDFFTQRHSILYTLTGYAVGIAVVVYAYRIGYRRS